MRVLVTGHLGFVGSHLCRVLQDTGCKVLGIDLKHGMNITSAVLPPNIDRVYHLAAQTNAQTTFAEGDAYVNIIGTVRVLERYGKRVVFASSSMINYPKVPYAISKLTGELYANHFGAAVVRFCNLYGEGGHSAIDVFSREDEITIRGSGEQKRTFAPVEDAVQMLLTAKPGHISVLRGKDYTVNEIAAQFPDKPIKHVPAGAFDLMEAVQR